MPEEAPPRPPVGIGKRGRELWVSIMGRYRMRPDQVELVVELVCAVDEIERLRRAVRKDGMIVAGAAGQLRPHPGLAQITARRATVARLSAQLRIPDPKPKQEQQQQQEHDGRRRRHPATVGKARKAAEARWNRPNA
jgi:hypothetical protein